MGRANRDGVGGRDARARTCAATRAVLDPEELIRFVFAPDGTIVPDVGRRLPGRGVWISCSRSAVAAAQKSGAFARSLRRSVATAPDLANVVERLLLRRAIDALSLANKAGLAVAGFTKVEALIASRECAALLHASDAADDGVGKLDRRLRAVWRSLGNEEEPRIVTALSSEELSLAMGRSNVVHAALRIGGAASNFLTDVGRLQRYRAAPDASAKSLGSGAKAEQV